MRIALISAMYIVLSLITFPIASGFIQVRISEGLTLLALIYSEAIFGVFFGCLISNLITGCVVFDIVFGSLISLISAILTFLTGKIFKRNFLKTFIGGLFPVLLNAFFLPLIWYYCYGKLEVVYIVQVLILILGQSLSVYAVGIPINKYISKLKNKGIKFL
ncbi:MAG: QueT transporter family protein [Clostridia bacterium]|nr:QueT transporter family protein [Clostridia bacterium]